MIWQRPSAPIGALAGQGDWLESARYRNFSVVADFERGRFAMPLLDGGGQPILTRTSEGFFPKRLATVDEIITTTRYDIVPNPGRQIADRMLWNRTDGTLEPLSHTQTRIENWMGTPALYVEPNRRSNRIPDAELPLPHSVEITRHDGDYWVSWLGNDGLMVTTTSHPETNQIFPAFSDDPKGLNWGRIATIPGWDVAGSATLFAAAGNPGKVAYNVLVDQNILYGPATFFPTAELTVGGIVRADCSPEHVRLSPAVLAMMTDSVSGRTKDGTMVFDQHNFTAPISVGTPRVVMGAGSAGSPKGVLRVLFDGTDYFYQSDNTANTLSLPVTEADIISRRKLGLTFRETGTQQRSIALQGVGAATISGTIGANSGFYFSNWISNAGSTTPGPAGGNSGFYSFCWCPETMTEEQLLGVVST